MRIAVPTVPPLRSAASICSRTLTRLCQRGLITEPGKSILRSSGCEIATAIHDAEPPNHNGYCICVFVCVAGFAKGILGVGADEGVDCVGAIPAMMFVHTRRDLLKVNL